MICRKAPLDGAVCAYLPLNTDCHCLKCARLKVDGSEAGKGIRDLKGMLI